VTNGRAGVAFTSGVDIAGEASSVASTVHDDFGGESVAESQCGANTESSGFISCVDAADDPPSPCWAAVAIVMSDYDSGDDASSYDSAASVDGGGESAAADDKHVSFDDAIQVYCIPFEGEGQFLPGRVRLSVPDAVDTHARDRLETAAINYGGAIYKALDLARGGRRRINEPEDDGLPTGASQQSTNNVKPPAVWLRDHVVTYDRADDGFASWGRPGYATKDCMRVIFTERDRALKDDFHKSKDYVHLGDVPWGAGDSVVYLSKPSVPFGAPSGTSSRVGPDAAASCGSVPANVIKLWLMDTGCGHDLVSERDLKQHSHKCRLADKPITFNTAGGPSPSKKTVKISVDELSETVDPYVLKSTPAVLSIGERCMVHDYEFLWPKGSNPLLIRPDGLAIELEVINNIPYNQNRLGDVFS